LAQASVFATVVMGADFSTEADPQAVETPACPVTVARSGETHVAFADNLALAATAHEPNDFLLASKFCAAAGLAEHQVDADGIKQLLKCIKMLRLCRYTAEDIMSMLNHAVAYMRQTLVKCGPGMAAQECMNTAILLIFVAHSYTQDETCPLRIWHKHLFAQYCTVKELDTTIISLMVLQQYVLRVPEEDLEAITAQLRCTRTCSSASRPPLSDGCDPSRLSRTCGTSRRSGRCYVASG